MLNFYRSTGFGIDPIKSVFSFAKKYVNYEFHNYIKQKTSQFLEKFCGR